MVYEPLYGGSERSNALQLKKARRRSTQIIMEREKTKQTNIKEITHTNVYNTTEVFFGEKKKPKHANDCTETYLQEAEEKKLQVMCVLITWFV